MARPLLVGLYGLTAVLCAVVTTVYVVFSTRTMPGLALLADRVGIERMQHLNRVAVRPPFMVCFFGAALASLVLVGLVVAGRRGPAAGLAAAAGLLYLLGFGLTVMYNVPLNDRLAALDPRSPDAAATWYSYLRLWTRANSVRAVLSAGATLLALAASVTGVRMGT